jgi:hypothetical protein
LAHGVQTLCAIRKCKQAIAEVTVLITMFKTPFSTWEPKWSETEHEVLRDFGHAAMAAQMLEAQLVQILLAGEYAGRISFNKKSDIETELFLSKKTFGQLIKELKRGGY